ncbi:MAG: heat-inducible transcription repressor HrcA [Chloroflexi bacterium]|nr:heat-inducible transcription repressor HrcA [Chloroflexota bacterium]
MPTLTTRKHEILKFIVSEHVQTASPVASSTVARSTNLKASPATIRNEMVALEEDGLIRRPHVSSGGVPSDRGYRQFVTSLNPEATLSPNVSARIDQEFQSIQAHVEEWIDTASEILAGLMDTLAFTTIPRTAPAPVKSIELLRLQEMLVVVIIVLQEASVYKQVINLESTVSNSDIEHARNRLSEAIVGIPTNNLAARAGRVGDGLERKAFDSALTALQQHSTGSSAQKRFSGMGKLFQQPELLADPSMSQGATWLIEDSMATSALENVSNPRGSASVVIGEENPEDSLKNFSVVFSKYGTSDTAEGMIGVMAPTRMEYEMAIPAVRYLANHLDQMTMMFYGG